MKLLLATMSLESLGGSETYVVTVADHLQRLGHDVWLHALAHGRSSDAAERLGVRVARDEDDLPDELDAIVVQDAAVSCELAHRFPHAPQVFVAHSDIFDIQLPLQLPGLVQAVITLYDRVERRVRAQSLEQEIVRLSQPVDVERFKPTRPLPERPRVALAMGNYLHGQRLALLAGACERVGIELQQVGAHGGKAEPGEIALNRGDIVFGKARVIHEAMACGRAAYVFDHNGVEGWVTAESYPVLVRDNFGGQSRALALDEERLAADLTRYGPGMGPVNRDLIVANHSATKHAAALAKVLMRVAPRSQPVDAPLRELARLVRLYHRADSKAFGLHVQAERLGARVHELDAELARTRAQVAKARSELDSLRASRRWRLMQAALRPADVLRRGVRRRRAAQERRRVPPAPPPAPFVVGAPRSGTTLLRLMLDAHSLLAIPPETGFVPVAASVAARGGGPDALLAEITRLPTWADLGLASDQARELLLAVRPWSVSEGLRVLYRAYARRHGKPRFGDKTPTHVRHVAALVDLLPEAHVIHLIRDGRDTAASVRGLHFSPGDGSVEAIARQWQDGIREARRQASGIEHYRELRYERLVTEPEAVLRQLCEWLELPWEDGVLRFHERAEQRFEELPFARQDGTVLRTREDRHRLHEKTSLAPDGTRIGRWRGDLSPVEVEAFESVAGALLAELGYEPAATGLAHA